MKFALIVGGSLTLILALASWLPSLAASPAEPDLHLSKTVQGAGGTRNLPLGSVVTYSIELANNGSSVAESVVMTDTLPAGLTFGGFVQPGSAVLPPPGEAVTLPDGSTTTSSMHLSTITE